MLKIPTLKSWTVYPKFKIFAHDSSMPGCPTKPGIDAFHRERSKCIDAFASLEEAVVSLLVRAKRKVGSESFGQRLELLRKAVATANLSNAQGTDIADFLARCEKVSLLRNDIVHSRLQIATIGEDQRACFTNTRDCLSNIQMVKLFTLEGLREVTAEASRLAQDLRS